MARNLLFCVPNTGALTADEAAFKAHREGLGDTFALFPHGNAVPGDLSAYDGVVFSNAMQTNQAAKWDSVDIPVFSMQLGRFLHTDMASVTFSSGGDARTTRYVESTVATSGGPTGLITVYSATPASTYDWILETNLAPNVVIYSRHETAGNRVTGILIPGGTTLLNGSVSPASNRACSHTDDYVNLTADGWTIVDEVFEWAVPDGTPGDTTAPSQPANLSAVVTDADVALTWDASTDDVGVDHYEVHRSTVSGFTPGPSTLIASPTTNSHTDSGLANGTYYYKVIAVDAADNKSAASAQVDAVVNVIDTEAPSAPTSLSGSVVGANVELSWNASTDNIGVTGYRVHRDTATGFTPGPGNLVDTVTETSYSDPVSGLTPGGTYYYKVIAVDAATNASTPSNEVTVVIADGAEVLNLLMVVSDTSALTTEDAWIRDFLENAGHTVALHPHASDPPADIGTYNAVIFGQSMQANQVYRWDASTAPVLSFSLMTFAHTKITTASFPSGGDTRQTMFFVVDPFGVNAPLSNVQTVYSAAPSQGYRWLAATAVPSARVITWHDAGLSRATGLAYDEGQTMADGVTVAPSRRVNLPFQAPTLLNADAQALVLRWLSWAARVVVPPEEDTTAPSAPAQPAVTVQGSRISLSWTASTDNVGVDHYEVHDGATSDFTPDETTLIALPSLPSHTYPDAASGVHHYKVIAVDAAGNKSSPSPVRSVRVAASFGLLAYEKQVDGSLVALAAAGIWNGSSVDALADAGDSGGTAPPPPPDPDPWVPGAQPLWETVGRAGLVDPPALSSQSGTFLTASGVEYLHKQFATGYVTVAGSNLVLRGCYIPDNLIVRGGTNVLVEDCDIGGLSISGAKFVTVRRCRIGQPVTQNLDGVHITSGTGRCQDVIIEDCYIGRPVITGDSHYDGIQVRGVDRLVVRGCYLDAGTVFNDRQNAPFFLENANGGNFDVTYQGNWSRAIGYGHMLVACDTLKILDNVFYRTVTTLLTKGRTGTNHTILGNTYDNGVNVDAAI